MSSSVCPSGTASNDPYAMMIQSLAAATVSRLMCIASAISLMECHSFNSRNSRA